MQASTCAGTSDVDARAKTSGKAAYAWLKPGVLVGALVPLGVLGQSIVRGTLGADPIAIVLNKLGLLALILLVASLAATPVRIVFGVNWPLRIRKLLGLLAFFYAALHFLVYVVIDQGLAFAAIARDVLDRKFITVGFAAFCLLVPLAVTSTSKMLKRLGAKRWGRLHSLVYLASTLACVHFVWRVKKDLSQPLMYAGVLVLLFAVRAWKRVRQAA
jgi:sulfoxide reductase heme-binding subunit YedZ